MTGVAFVGTGFVADYYMTTLANHPELQLIGVWDQNPHRLAQFCAFYDVQAFESYDAVLGDPRVAIVVNLTNPQSHFEMSSRALDAGKHVYSEKPLAMQPEQIAALGAKAKERALSLCSAPANAHSAAFHHCARLLAEGRIGTPHAVYAEMEDGPVHWDNWREWRSVSGAHWPGLHEFELGCTLEHAGYALSWMLALFGPVRHVAANASLVFPDKGKGTETLTLGPDLTMGLLQFDNGIAARLTCGLASERKRSLTIMGDRGMLVVRDLWDHYSPINLTTPDRAKNLLTRVAGRIERRRQQALPLNVASGEVVRSDADERGLKLPLYPSRIDFARGIAKQAAGIGGGSPAFFSADVAMHMSEVTLALNRGDPSHVPLHSFDLQSA